ALGDTFSRWSERSAGIADAAASGGAAAAQRNCGLSPCSRRRSVHPHPHASAAARTFSNPCSPSGTPMALNYLAPAPYASFVTRNGAFQADANGLISNVGAGVQAIDLLEVGCVPLAFNPFANFRNLIDGGDFSINPFQRNIPGLASGGVIVTPIAATPTYFADRFFACGGASSAIVTAVVSDATVQGFNQSLKVSRKSGNNNLSTIFFGQVIETFDSLRCQGQTVTLSFWARSGATYSGGPLMAQVVEGNGTNQ